MKTPEELYLSMISWKYMTRIQFESFFKQIQIEAFQEGFKAGYEKAKEEDDV